jgi:WD40 repeat protein
VTGGDPRPDVLSALRRAVSLESDVLAVRPDLTWQQLANRLQWTAAGPAELVAEEAGRRAAAGEAWLRLRTRFPESSALLRRFNPRSDQLSSCVLTPDGTLAVSTGMDRTVRVWNAANGRVVRVLRGAGSAVACAVTPAGRYALATSGDGALHAWRVDNGLQVATVAAHNGPANACAALPDGHAVVTFGADGRVRLWLLPELHPGGLVAENAGHLTFGALSGDGGTVAYGSRGSGLVQLRSIRGGGPGPADVDAGCPVLSCAFGDTPTVLLAGLTDGRLSVWDLPAGRRREVRAHDGEVLACALSPDGTLAASAGDDDTVRLWRLPELAPVATLQGHQWGVTGCGFSADGSLLVSAGGDGTACLWDTAAAQAGQPTGHSQLVECCDFTPGGASLLTASTDGTFRRWAVSTGTEQGPVVRHPGSTVRMARHGGRVVLAAGDDGTLILVPSPEAEAVPVGTHGAQVWGLSLVSDGATAVTAGPDGACWAWDLDGSAERLALPGDGHPLRTCAGDPSGSHVAAAGDAGIVHLYDVETRSHAQLAGHQAPIWSVGISPAGRVAAGAKDGSVRLWSSGRPAAGQLLGRQADSVEHLLWAGPERLISGAVDGSIAVWPLTEDGQPLREDGQPLQWTAHRGPVRGIAVAPTGDVLVSAGADGLLAAWNLRDGTLLASIPFPGQLRAVVAHPTDPVVAATGDGGLVHIAELACLPHRW